MSRKKNVEPENNGRIGRSLEPQRHAPDRSLSDMSEESSSKPNVFQRLRSRSRSRQVKSKDMLVAVTSCRSDGYYNQKAPGSIFKLPRKAPTNLKLFHELAVGVKDAYNAVDATPKSVPEEEKNVCEPAIYDAKNTLFEFIGNLDFVSRTDERVCLLHFLLTLSPLCSCWL